MIVRHSSSTPVSGTTQMRYWSTSTCSWGSWSDYQSYAYNSETEYALGEDIAKFHLKKKRGDLLPFTRYINFEARESPCLFDVSAILLTQTSCGGVKDVYEQSNRRFDPLNTSTVELTDLPSDLMTEGSRFLQAAVAKIYSQGFDALTFISELKSLVRMLTSILSRWADLLRRGHFEDLWLEGRYGWRPLIYDIRDFENALSNLSSEVARYKERVGFTHSTSDTIVADSYWSGDTIRFTYFDSIENSVRGSVVMDIAPPRFRFDPISTAWELIPFSFVVDWLIDIGSWLASLNGLTISRGQTAGIGIKTTRIRQIVSVEQVASATNYRRTFTRLDSGVNDYTLLSRVPMAIPYSLPTIDLNIDFLKIIDLISLIIQRARH